MSKAKLFSPRYLVYDFVKVTAALPGLVWLRPKWIYESEKAKRRIRGGALVVSNHYGFSDPVEVMFAIWYRRHHFICGKEFFETRARWWFKSFLCIPIDRANVSFSSIRTITDELAAGSLVTIFPEGHISGESGDMEAFKPGMVLMALKGGAPIVPVYVKPRKRFFERARLVIGEPVDLAEICGPRPTMAEIESVARLVREREEKLKTLA